MSERKAVIKNADMSEDMQQDAIDCSTQARASLSRRVAASRPTGLGREAALRSRGRAPEGRWGGGARHDTRCGAAGVAVGARTRWLRRYGP
jgi:hypothetical protein